MTFKFRVGESVEYHPRGENLGMFTVIRHLPEEPSADALRYVIKSAQENFERTVFEYTLAPSDGDERRYIASERPRRIR